MTDVLESPVAPSPTVTKPSPVPVEPEVAFATLGDLLSKPVTFDEFDIKFPDGKVLRFRFEAIDGPRFDQLMASCPPTTKQRANNQTYDPVKFSAVLLAAVSKQPSLSAEQWTQVIASPNWSGGEAAQLFNRAMDLCMKQNDLTPTSAG